MKPRHATTDDPLLRPEEARAMLNVTDRELKTLRDSGRLAFHQLNLRSLRYRTSDIAAFLDASRIQAR